ncbi:toxic anion resistance protein [Lysobacter daejeonensis GH1-9]|uniref:Toxic anion resistance protein n=1 Tax=Lysobacter daejeonensis GH1-9 TaxID=1385517 RepID=A0A0A0ESZ6_9GAMM|nr:toxic anion resistance protein [Lysobacter daejeonensis]KGM54076.1 toxic anion resistance protein [Lysobacter daejeonensis GH1-9]
MTESTTDVANPLSVPTLDEATLLQLGLAATDLDRVGEIRATLVDLSPANVQGYGRDAATKTTQFSSELLDQVRNRDLDATGDKLGEVVRIARNLNLQKFGGRSKLPVIGPLIDRVRGSKGELVQKFSTTNQQIEHLMRDVSRQQEDLGRRVRDFDRMHGIVVVERHELGLHVAAGKLRLAELEVERSALEGRDDPEARARRQEIDGAVRLLDKRVGDLLLLQHAADQSLPMIRMIQANAMQLIEKFATVRDITIPAWKRSFAIQLSLNEQKSAVELANAIDDATNELMRRNADMLHENSVATAKANQRGVVDVETLQHVHEKLIQTVEDVRQIHREGIEKRRQAEQDLSRMRDDVQKRLAAPTLG